MELILIFQIESITQLHKNSINSNDNSSTSSFYNGSSSWRNRHRARLKDGLQRSIRCQEDVLHAHHQQIKRKDWLRHQNNWSSPSSNRTIWWHTQARRSNQHWSVLRRHHVKTSEGGCGPLRCRVVCGPKEEQQLRPLVVLARWDQASQVHQCPVQRLMRRPQSARSTRIPQTPISTIVTPKLWPG